MVKLLILGAMAASFALAQPRMPDTAAQRAAMKKLEFLLGKWEGEARVTRGAGEPLQVRQSEDVQMKLGGLLLLVEGTGRDESGKVVFNALAVISYDDQAGQYRIRAHNDGRVVDAELKLAERGFEWGFATGPGKVSYVMKINEKGEWVETGDFTMGSSPPRRFIEMTVRPVK